VSRAYQFERSSRLAAPAAEVVGARDGDARREPRAVPARAHDPPARSLGARARARDARQRAFRSWIFALGVVPIDYDDLTFVELEWGRRFLERSPMLTQREWQHEARDRSRAGRRLHAHRSPGASCRACRALGPLFLAEFRLTFWVRHWHLRRCSRPR
jgi:hypothetical protein